MPNAFGFMTLFDNLINAERHGTTTLCRRNPVYYHVASR